MFSQMSLPAGMQIYRYEVPVDGQWHEHTLMGPVLSVACRRRGVVEFWSPGVEAEAVAASATLRGLQFRRRFLVVGTGERIPESAYYRGTVLDADGALVWHLLEGVGDGR